MKKTQMALTFAILAAIFWGLVSDSQAGTKLEENAALSGLIGNWVSKSEDGRSGAISYRWGLNKNIVISRFNMGGLYAGHGLIYYDPAQSKILHAGVDSVGGLGSGHLQFKDKNTIWKMRYVGADSEQRNMGIVYTRDGRKTLKMEYYGLDDSGNLAGEPRRTTEFERKSGKQQKKNKLPESSQTATLGDLVDMGGFDWVIGNWAGEIGDDQKINFSYSWGMNKNIINMAFKMGEDEALGMIFYSPHDGKVMHIDVDSKGSFTKGVWDAEGDSLVANVEQTIVDGRREKFAAVHTNIDAKTMTVAFYGIGESGDRMPYPFSTGEFKRQPKKAAAKTRANKKAKTD